MNPYSELRVLRSFFDMCATDYVWPWEVKGNEVVDANGTPIAFGGEWGDAERVVRLGAKIWGVKE